MSDYLNHLVARSEGLTEVVQPRLTSLFEPLPGNVGAITQSDNNLEELEDLTVSVIPNEPNLVREPWQPRSRPTDLKLAREQTSVEQAERRPNSSPQKTSEASAEKFRQKTQPEQTRATFENELISTSLEQQRLAPPSEENSNVKPANDAAIQSSQAEAGSTLIRPIVIEQLVSSSEPPPKPPLTEQSALRPVDSAVQPVEVTENRLHDRPSSFVTPSSPEQSGAAIQPSRAEAEASLIRPIVIEQLVSSSEPPPKPSLTEQSALRPVDSAVKSRETGENNPDDKIYSPMTSSKTKLEPKTDETVTSPTSSPTRLSSTAIPFAQSQLTSSAQLSGAGSSQPTTSTQVSPTIQVTIGRIEVRATTPPVSPKPKSRLTKPVMSLDDYLRQRGQEDRS